MQKDNILLWAMQRIKETPHIGKCENDVELFQILAIAYARQGDAKEGLRWIDEAIALKKEVVSACLVFAQIKRCKKIIFCFVILH